MAKRIIMHIDMNSYFATVEQQSNPLLRGKPICVAGKSLNSERTVCCAASVEAKKFGLKSGMGVWEAKNLCPNITIVTADYLKYQFISQKFIRLLENYTPLIEVFSIDEAFLDLTGQIDSLEEVIPIAMEIKSRLKEEIGDYLTCSVGISTNKLMAKLASEKVKPDGLTLIREDEIKKILLKTPIEELCGIGRRLEPRLNALGIKTAGELGCFSTESLTRLFGPHLGQKLSQMGKGIDSSPVVPYYEMPPEKSFGHSYTLPKDISQLKEINKVLLKLAEKVGRRMRQAKAMGRTIYLYVRFFDRTGKSMRITISTFTNDGFQIYLLAKNLLKKCFTGKPIRLIAVSMTNIKPSKNISQAVLPLDQQNDHILKMLDKINNRYGEFTIFRANLTQIKDRIENIPDGRNKRFI